MKKTLIFGVLASSLFACKEAPLTTYPEGENSVYFAVKNTNKSIAGLYKDTTVFSFADYFTSDTIVSLPINALGDFAGYDRTFAYQVLPEGTTAKLNDDFELVGQTNLIKANKIAGTIEIKLKRSEVLASKVLYIRLQLLENQDFNLAIKREFTDLNNNKFINLVEHTIAFFDFITRPVTWDRVQSRLGNYSTDKYKLVSHLCDMTSEDWKNLNSIRMIDLMWVRTRNYLQREIDKGTPVQETREDGSKGNMEVMGLIWR
ncbi:MAG: DUF4843 domain-containing protein [Mucinivorans sp.]